MLGSMVLNYLSGVNGCEVETISGRWPTEQFKKSLLEFSGDVVVNCIGAIPQRTSEFDINFELPLWLDSNVSSRVIHAGTDCESDQDDYGISKRKASEYLQCHGQNTNIIKCSIIGPEVTGNEALLEWFLSSKSDVQGYSKQMWNGITTLQWAKVCWNIINDVEDFEKVTIPFSECISKFRLLSVIKEVYGKDITIHENDEIKINKCLKGNLPTPKIKDQLLELKEIHDAKY